MKFEDLVSNKYYFINDPDILGLCYFIHYKCHDDIFVYCNDELYIETFRSNLFVVDSPKNIFKTIHWFSNKEINEIDEKDYIDMFPSFHIFKISYIRKNKIKYLLNI